MADPKVNLEQQRQLLQSLGFGFVTEPLPEFPAEEEPVAAPPPRPKAPAPAQPKVAPAPTNQPAISRTASAPAPERLAGLEALAAEVRACAGCPLNLMRSNAVPGMGAPGARLFIIGELPSEEDDRAGKPFQGEIGDMLANIVKAIGLSMADAYLTHAVKSRPAGGRATVAAEIAACRPFLSREIELVRPEIIVSFGIAPIQSLLPDQAAQGISRIRGEWLDYRGIPVMPTFALPYIFRNTQRKRVVWEDLQKLMPRLK